MCLILMFAGIAGIMTENMFCTEAVRMLQRMNMDSVENRMMQCSEQTIGQIYNLTRCTNVKAGEILAAVYPEMKGNYLRFPSEFNEKNLLKRKHLYMKECREAYERVSEYYGAVWNDIRYFPVSADANVVYENSWMFERNYGGERGHEGTDLMPELNLSGYYRIFSMTDGVVEKIGWLPLGGYRIGIRSPSGGYFYYAHLDSYAGDFSEGDVISAGQTLGYMGDTGYGEEGMRGQFPVHLHLGIYVQTDSDTEISVNPYWVLRYSSYFMCPV